VRASEFLIEKHVGKIGKRRQAGTRGLTKFRDIGGYDRTYELNRVMMAVASADGIQKPVMDKEAWNGKRNTAHPYTEVEQQMLKHAYQVAGIPHNDINNGDLESKELDSTHVISPIKPFKGYKK
jgi:hypothetical protein